MKAMILAAGQGERLRPLTENCPKPLLKIGDYSLIEYHLYALASQNITEIVINVHYLGRQIIDYLGDGSRYNVSIVYSVEEPACLGTGGGIFKALPLLGDEHFVLISADIWTEYRLTDAFLQSTDDIHLVLVDNPNYNPQGDFGLTQHSKLTLMGDKLNYSGIAKLHPRIFFDSKPGIFSLSPFLVRAIENQSASGEYYSGPWFNIGTVEELHKLQKFLFNTHNNLSSEY